MAILQIGFGKSSGSHYKIARGCAFEKMRIDSGGCGGSGLHTRIHDSLQSEPACTYRDASTPNCPA